MSGLKIYTSNRLEALLELLAAVTARPLRSPLAKEIIVVQSMGMHRWLALELAKKQGICANVEFPFPQTFFNENFRNVLGAEFQNGRLYERKNLSWRIMELLPGLLSNSAFEPLQHYLDGENAGMRQYQLAKKIASVFDQYLVFRPDMILKWDERESQKDWQAILWRELATTSAGEHLPTMGNRFAKALRSSAFTPETLLKPLSERISVFGISTLPKFYLDLLSALSEKVETHLFLMQPTPHEWTEIRSAREETRMLRKQPGETVESLHIERGNPLLASFGKAGREFLYQLLDLEIAEEIAAFEASSSKTMLSRIQRDIFDLHDPSGATAEMAVSEIQNEQAKQKVANDDHSIQVHSCHSPMREMETLRDQLLALCERDSDLKPRDILVVMPDVESYAPFIDAVFGATERDKKWIPYTIADRAARSQNSAADAFLQMLDLAGSRLEASRVLALLEMPCIREKFAINERDFGQIRNWVKAVMIRWGRDAAHRAEFGVPAFSQNSWRAGMDRLLLGYALRGEEEKVFAGILPYDEIEGSASETLGDFADWISRLFDAVAEMEIPHSLMEWQTLFREMADDLFAASDESERGLLQLRSAFDTLSEITRESGFDEKIGIDVMRSHLAETLESTEHFHGFLEGKMTFCALKPMRSIPFKVICAVGMNDGSFPRHQQAVGFDKISKEPRFGDRTTREDDRYLFLELLLSARSAFYLSYTGQSLRDNGPLPPSVVVSDLLDYLETRFESAAGHAISKEVKTVHKLQLFNPAYFQCGKLFSYSLENYRGSLAAQNVRKSPESLFHAPLREPDEEFRTISVWDLMKFFKNPTQFLLEKRLGMKLDSGEEMLDDDEPFSTNHLAAYRWKQSLTAKRLDNGSAGELLVAAKLSGDFPPGISGELEEKRIGTETRNFAETVRKSANGDLLPPVPINLQVGQFLVTGVVDGIRENGLLRYRCAKLKTKDLLALWIPLVALNAATKPVPGTLIANDHLWKFQPPENSETILETLLDLYWQGLSAPLSFFLESSFVFAQTTFQNEKAEQEKKKPKNAKAVAEGKWSGDWNGQAEKNDLYFNLAFRAIEEPLDEEWERIACAVFDPLLHFATEEKQ